MRNLHAAVAGSIAFHVLAGVAAFWSASIRTEMDRVANITAIEVIFTESVEGSTKESETPSDMPPPAGFSHVGDLDTAPTPTEQPSSTSGPPLPRAETTPATTTEDPDAPVEGKPHNSRPAVVSPPFSPPPRPRHTRRTPPAAPAAMPLDSVTSTSIPLSSDSAAEMAEANGNSGAQQGSNSTGMPAVPAISTSPEPADRIAIVHDPKFLRPPHPPSYPKRAMELDQQGVVLVRALVLAPGKPQETVVWQSSGFPLLDAAATVAVSGWEFEPLRLSQEARPAWVQIPVRFKLK